MSKFNHLLALAHARKQEGATAVEYGLIVGLIAVAIYVTLGVVGTDLNTLFGSVETALTK